MSEVKTESLETKINRAVGELTLAIGMGDFRGAVSRLIHETMGEAYHRGISAGNKHDRDELPSDEWFVRQGFNLDDLGDHDSSWIINDGHGVCLLAVTMCDDNTFAASVGRHGDLWPWDITCRGQIYDLVAAVTGSATKKGKT